MIICRVAAFEFGSVISFAFDGEWITVAAGAFSEAGGLRVVRSEDAGEEGREGTFEHGETSADCSRVGFDD